MHTPKPSPLNPVKITEKKLMIVAGEASGDLLGAGLVDELRKLNPLIEIEGLGGPHMQNSGVHLYQDFTKLAVMGITEVLAHYATFRKIFYDFLKRVDQVKPDAVILIDYPGFNLRLAKKLKERNIKVIYYVSPQVWAWKKNRVKIIEKYVDKLLVLFPFEKEFYKPYNINVEFVGHPLVENVKASLTKKEFIQKHHLQDNKLTIAILPGSRKMEVQRIFPPMIEAARIIKEEFSQTQFLILKAPTINRTYLESFIPKQFPNFHVIDDQTYNGINASDICMVVSGTATLEIAMFEKPMVILYRASLVSYMIGRMVIKLKHLGLVNIISEKEICPELIQDKATPENIAQTLKNIFSNEIAIAQMREDLKNLKTKLSCEKASLKAAQAVLTCLET